MVHHNVTVLFKDILHGLPGIPPPLLVPLACSLLMFMYPSIIFSAYQVIGLLVWRRHDSCLFLSILFYDDILFLSIPPPGDTT